jgi:hypothetical protein
MTRRPNTNFPEADSDGYRFHVRQRRLMENFRLLDQLPTVRTNPKALALVESILDIGEQMTKIISERAVGARIWRHAGNISPTIRPVDDSQTAAKLNIQAAGTNGILSA